MINQAITTKLVKIYFYVCDKYDDELKYCCQRFTNNNSPEFTDQEIMTIYLFCVNLEKRFKIKQMYEFVKNYFLDWFPKLPSYTAFVTRLNRLSEAFKGLAYRLIEENKPNGTEGVGVSLLDSMPIIICSGKRKGAVARDIADKGFCSTKGIYYYGVKLHCLAFGMGSTKTLPYPESIVFSKASENDLTVFKENWADIPNRVFYGDKIYIDKHFFEKFYDEKNSTMLTPIKLKKGEPENLRQFDKAYNDLYSKAVSAVRQPIEAFFNAIIEKTDIQRASKVRSTKGLLVHLFGKMAAVFLNPIFNS
jgi:hypothetical protein